MLARRAVVPQRGVGARVRRLERERRAVARLGVRVPLPREVAVAVGAQPQQPPLELGQGRTARAASSRSASRSAAASSSRAGAAGAGAGVPVGAPSFSSRRSSPPLSSSSPAALLSRRSSPSDERRESKSAARKVSASAAATPISAMFSSRQVAAHRRSSSTSVIALVGENGGVLREREPREERVDGLGHRVRGRLCAAQCERPAASEFAQRKAWSRPPNLITRRAPLFSEPPEVHVPRFTLRPRRCRKLVAATCPTPKRTALTHLLPRYSTATPPQK